MKKTPADRVTLWTTRRPSNRTSFKTAKSESNNTSWAVWRAASLPCPTEMLQSASFNANKSLTPSPVIATVCFWRWNAWISCFFCCGVTLPKTVYCAAAASISESATVRISTQRSPWKTPACCAIAEAVIGLSPEISFTETPSCWNAAIVFAALARSGSVRMISASSCISGSGCSFWTACWVIPAKRTRFPFCCASRTFSGNLSEQSFSGAPMTSVPTPENVIALHFRSEENEICSVTDNVSIPSK